MDERWVGAAEKRAGPSPQSLEDGVSASQGRRNPSVGSLVCGRKHRPPAMTTGCQFGCLRSPPFLFWRDTGWSNLAGGRGGKGNAKEEYIATAFETGSRSTVEEWKGK